jgi:hypothetical protein
MAVPWRAFGLRTGALALLLLCVACGRRARGDDDRALRRVEMAVSCRSPGHRISPLVYGIAFIPLRDRKEQHQFALGASARRWGGNHTSRYNWELGNAWNTGADWYFRNVNYGGLPVWSWTDFLDDQRSRGFATALTVPILGWVAKDRESYSFPVAVVGPQQRVDPWRPDAGNGLTKDGERLAPPPPTQTSVEFPPAKAAAWVRAIRARDARLGGRSVDLYLLDNEPMLWNTTHRDVHPEPAGYDEVLERIVAYGAAVRGADPDAVIAGPGLWGWLAYNYSAKDAAAGFRNHPDREAHGDVPFLPWLLRQLRAHEQRTGVRVLDAVDVHFYPMVRGSGLNVRGATDPEASARRIRATRALWDERYVDESWIAEPIALIPRLRRWIAENYPGRGIVIGEYNFGAEDHPSGGLALAEALGRFGEQGIDAAFYWSYPAKGSHALWAFRAYRNFDGRGGRFQDFHVPSSAGSGTSLFASRDQAGRRVVAIALNLEPDRPAEARIDLGSCGRVESVRAYLHGPDDAGLVEVPAGTVEAGVLARTLPPWSILVLDVGVVPGDRDER